MIKTAEMKPVLQRLYDKAVEGKSGPYKLTKTLLPKYSTVECYNPGSGGRYFDILDDYLPCMVLGEEGVDNSWMVTYPEDFHDNTPITNAAQGKMLSIGLGIGLLPEMLKEKLDNKTVTHLDIVEISLDVAKLTWNHQKRPEMNLIICDAWDFLKQSDSRYDTIWMDILCKRHDAVIGGPIMAQIAQRLLKPGGTIKWWLKEITESLRAEAKPFELNKGPCKICGVSPHMNYYGGLCLECAEAYEAWISHYRKKGYDYYEARKELGIN